MNAAASRGSEQMSEETAVIQVTGSDIVDKDAITAFDWRVYGSATLAGVAVLIPIPVVDLIVEELYRRRMPRDIATRNGQTLSVRQVVQLNRRRDNGRLLGCLLLPIRAIFYLFRNIFRTVLYALSVVDAADNLGYYWHRAFLINYIMRRGYLDDPARSETAIRVMHDLLNGLTTDPLTQLAQQILAIWGKQVIRLRAFVRYARKKEESAELSATKAELATAWGDYRKYLLEIAARYETQYHAQLQAQGAQARS